jgi:DNA repair exonuclease SbcCD ATPase subunit
MKKLISELKKEMEKADCHTNEATLYEALEFKDDYFDFPIATGKRVLIEELRVTGNKHNGEKIDYQQKFYSGINIIIADNLKGKSSIFKIIKLAFTGKDSLKPDVSSWVNKIILGFRISDKNYAIYIDKSASRMIGSLYSTTIDNINIESTENEVFKTMTKTDYETQIEAFFFNQFSYYSLSWTQKDSAKNSIELREAKASWRTYFKSIYLESKDSISFYGNQDSKTFQILLGLKYTKIINELMIKKDFIRNTIAKKDGQKDLSITEQEHLYAELSELEKRLDSLQKNSDYMEFQTLKKLQDNLISDIQKSSMLFNSSNSQYYQIVKDLDVERTVHDSLVREKERLEKEVAKLTRKTNDLREYLELGYFFSNLTIKTCPSCNHEVNLPSTSSEHHCNLCQKPVVSEKENKEQFAERIIQLSEAKSTLEAKIVQIKSKISILWINIEKLEKEKLNTEKIIQNNNYDELSEKSGLVTKKLDELKNKLKENLNAEDELIAQKAVLNYRLRENSSDCNNSIDKLRQSLKILEISIDYLIEKRFQ